MGIKDTKLWKYLRKKKYDRIKHQHYLNVQKMNTHDYEQYLKDRYVEFMSRKEYTKGKTLSFDNPQTFTEKSQWIKLYDQDPRKPQLADKYRVRDFIKKTIGEEYLIPIISIDGVDHFENANDIDFEKLPNKFVLKCNHGSHMNIIVENKAGLTKKDIKNIRKKLNNWLNVKYAYVVSLETQYLGIKPCIYIEEYFETKGPLRDYKFLCFNGHCHYFWINEDVVDDKKETCTTFCEDLSVAPFNMNLGFRKNISNMELPKNIKTMLEIANKLANDFVFVRVDLYNLDGKIYFGEMTFNSAAGYDVPYPGEYDLELGKLMKIDLSKRDNNFTYRKQ